MLVVLGIVRKGFYTLIGLFMIVGRGRFEKSGVFCYLTGSAEFSVCICSPFGGASVGFFLKNSLKLNFFLFLGRRELFCDVNVLGSIVLALKR